MSYILNPCRSNGYDRKRAVEYALKYALQPNESFSFLGAQREGGGDCSNFVSQCLRAGGAPMAYDSIAPWWYKGNGNHKDSWSYSWTVAHALYLCLKARNKRELPGLKGIEVKDIEFLEIGDVIQYEKPGGRIYHSVIITDFITYKGEKHPLVSQHSYNAVNISYVKPAAAKMHFMKIII